MKKNEHFSVTYKVRTLDPKSTTAPYIMVVDSQIRDKVVTQATSYNQVVGFAMRNLFLYLLDTRNLWSKKYTVIEFDGMTLSPTMAAPFFKEEWEFESLFEVTRTGILARKAMSSREHGVQFVRATDVGGVYKKTKDSSITVSQIGAQITEKLRSVKEGAKWEREDAVASVNSPEHLRKRQERLLTQQANRKLLNAAKK